MEDLKKVIFKNVIQVKFRWNNIVCCNFINVSNKCDRGKKIGLPQ